jgi:hypothetical protein
LLDTVVKNERFEPHPVSGEVEIDWENEVDVTYKRVDEETLQALISLQDLGLGVKLIWCVNDELGGGDGWRIGEVVVLDPNTSERWGQKSITLAESIFSSQKSQQSVLSSYNQRNGTSSLLAPEAEADDEDDADYWAQYDNTPARTPAPKHSPAPPVNGLGGDLRAHMDAAEGGEEGEEEYYKQYATVQPAMDNHDPDEAAQNGHVESSLGKDDIITAELSQQRNQFPPNQDHEILGEDMEWTEGLKQPRPGSSGSSGSDTVAKLEKRAAAAQKEREVGEVGIRQHIGTSVKSLYRLARGAGIERGEFERLVRTELECLGLMDEDD